MYIYIYVYIYIYIFIYIDIIYIYNEHIFNIHSYLKQLIMCSIVEYY